MQAPIIYLTPEHEMLQDQVARFIAREVEPHAQAWEDAGSTPREVLRKLVDEVVQGCQQFHGGIGYMRETAIERLWRDARVLAIGGGATEVMLEEVAKRY